MDTPKKTINIVIDFCTYSPAMLQAAVDMAAAAKQTDYANMRIVIPPALLYEMSGGKATCTKQLLSPALRKDKGVRALREIIDYGMRKRVILIPKCSEAETRFFSEHKLWHGERQHPANLPGPKAPADFGDHAILDWLVRNPPNAYNHFVVSTQDAGVSAGLMHAVPGNINDEGHLNFFEEFDQKCMAQWIAEESECIKKHAALYRDARPATVDALSRLDKNGPALSDIKPGRPGSNDYRFSL